MKPNARGPSSRCTIVSRCCSHTRLQLVHSWAFQEDHDAVSWLVLEGSVLLFDWCEPLSVLGHGEVAAEFLVWSTLAMEGMVSLSTVKVPANAGLKRASNQHPRAIFRVVQSPPTTRYLHDTFVAPAEAGGSISTQLGRTSRTLMLQYKNS